MIKLRKWSQLTWHLGIRLIPWRPPKDIVSLVSLSFSVTVPRLNISPKRCQAREVR